MLSDCSVPVNAFWLMSNKFKYFVFSGANTSLNIPAHK
jgi:hypothetical protein